MNKALSLVLAPQTNGEEVGRRKERRKIKGREGNTGPWVQNKPKHNSHES